MGWAGTAAMKLPGLDEAAFRQMFQTEPEFGEAHVGGFAIHIGQGVSPWEPRRLAMLTPADQQPSRHQKIFPGPHQSNSFYD
jgi:hypothetical protein